MYLVENEKFIDDDEIFASDLLMIFRSFTLSKFVILHLFELDFYLFFTSILHEFYLFRFWKQLCNITQ